MQVMLKILRFFNLILNVNIYFFYSDSAFLCHISPDSRVLHAQTSQRPVSKLALLNTTAP